MLQAPSRTQVQVWDESVAALHTALRQLVESQASASSWGIILEYELPRERGRRPDALLLAPGRLGVIEFKSAVSPKPEFVDQVAAYARDLSEYHAGTHDLRTIPILVTSAKVQFSERHRAFIVGQGDLGALLVDQFEASSGPLPELLAWAESEYAPLPALVTAARKIFNHEPLPAIRRAQSAGIPEALSALSAAVSKAEMQGERHLALVTGVPGAGKTLVGLQFVYATRSQSDDSKDAVLLSGNGPLVKVLQHALNSRVFVQDVHGFLKRYGGMSKRTPMERIWVYDEAQRAWDSEQVQAFRDHDLSEPDDFLNLGARVPDWAMMVGLVGEGQEIHVGEESGIAQWNDAIAKNPLAWHVHCPARLSTTFPAAASVTQVDALDLTTSLRSHTASEVQDWVKELLLGRLDQAATAAVRAQNSGYVMYLCDNLERAKDYVRTRYQDAPDARFGLVASSKAKNLETHGIRAGFLDTRKIRVGPWFNDEPSSPNSCCQLEVTVTEFQCQGLELDFPIVGWGNDLTWNGAQWESRKERNPRARDPHNLRLNSYRVLLSRGRDGILVFCPPETPTATREALLYSGLTLLR